MHMRVDKTGNQYQTLDIDYLPAIIVFTDSDNRVTAYRDISRDHSACNQIKHPPATQRQVRRFVSTALGYSPFKT